MGWGLPFEFEATLACQCCCLHSASGLCLLFPSPCLPLTASAPKSLRSSWSSEDEAASGRQEEVWPALGDRSLVPMVEQLFSHLLKVINICAHVLDDVTPGPALKVPGRGSPVLPGFL